jgi:hypothetical protein
MLPQPASAMKLSATTMLFAFESMRDAPLADHPSTIAMGEGRRNQRSPKRA